MKEPGLLAPSLGRTIEPEVLVVTGLSTHAPPLTAAEPLRVQSAGSAAKSDAKKVFWAIE